MTSWALYLTNPVVWASRRNVARKLRGFAEVEAESVLEMRAAAALTEDDGRRALYLRHALDEERHARVFARAATGIDGVPGRAHVSAEDLFERLGERRFLAFVHRGERRGRQQFESYRDYWRQRDPRLAATFEGVLEDEMRHEAYTRELLRAVVGTERDVRSALRWAAAWSAWQRYRRAGRLVAKVVYVAVMLVVYVALAPLAGLVRWRQPAVPGWTSARSTKRR